MIKKFLFIILFLLSSNIFAQARYYVSVGGSGTMDGSSWANTTTLDNSLTLISSNDEIWIQAGTYLVNNTLQINTANINIYGGFEGVETQVDQRDYNLNETILDGQNTVKIMRFGSDAGVLDGITFTNGFVTGSASSGHPDFTNDGGGALRLAGSNSIVRNCTFRNNVSTSARGAGAIFIWFGNGQIIDNCIFDNNRRESGFAGNGGGAIHNWDTNVTIQNSTFTNNTAVNSGGAIYTWGTNFNIENCLFDNNSSNTDGGAIFVNNKEATITNSTFRNNSALESGGAINNRNQTYITNTVFYANTASNVGGALYNYRELYVTNSTFTANTNTAIVHTRSASTASTLRTTNVYNSIFFNNFPKDNDYFADISIINPATTTDLSDKDFRYNILEENTFGSNNLIGIDPLFVNNSNDFNLQTNSLAINLGNNALYNAVSGETAASSVDLANLPRLFQSTIDLGAYENQSTSTLDVPSTCADLVSPTDGETNVLINVNTISWDVVSDASNYRVSVDGSLSNDNDITDQIFTTTSYHFTNDFDYGETVNVTIIPFNATGEALGCVIQSFTIESLIVIPNCTTLTSPLNGATDVSISTDLTWDAVLNADGYYVSVGTTSGGNDILNAEDVTNTTFNLPANLDENTEYFITITPYNSAGNATSCSEESFTTVNNTPIINDLYVDLSAPAGGDGLTWATAFQKIESAVAIATSDDTIFIAEGIYRPEYELDVIVPLNFKGSYPAGGGVQDIAANVTQIQGDFDSSILLNRIFEIHPNSETFIEGIRFFETNRSIYTGSNLVVNNVQFEATTSTAIYISSGITDVEINNSLFSNIADTHIYNANNSVNNLTVNNCIFQNGSASIFSLSDDVINFTTDNSTIRDYTINERIFVLNAQNSTISNSLVENNTLNNNPILGVYDANLTITNSDFINNFGETAICFYARFSNVTLENSNFNNNTANGSFAAGVFNLNNSVLNASDCSFNNNDAQGSQPDGIGSANGAATVLSFDNCEFSNNSANGSIAYGLFKLFTGVSLTVTNSVIDGNEGGYGSAINMFTLGEMILENNIFRNHNNGGPIISTYNSTSGNVTLTNNTFENNAVTNVDIRQTASYTSSGNHFQGPNSSVILQSVSNASLTDDYFRGNADSNEFLYVTGTDVNITNTVMISELLSGPHYLIQVGNNVSQHILNCTFSASNIDDTHIQLQFDNGQPSTVYNSILWAGSNLTESALTGGTDDLTISHSIIKGENPTGAGNIDGTLIGNRPRFVNPSAFNFRAMPCSPTVNVGNNTFITESLDILDNPRIFESTVDMGAYELQEAASATCDPPSVPLCTTLTLPINGATNVSIATDLTWDTISNADGYYVSIGTTSGGTDVLNAEDVTNTTFNLPTDLDENTEYFVTIIPYNSVGNATGCTEESFTTESIATIPDCTILISPLNGETDVSITTDLTWNSVSNADGYYISVGTTSGGNDVLNAEDVTNTTFNLPADLDENTEYFVTIIPYNSVGNATACTEESFTTETIATIPDCTTLISPLNGTTDVSIATGLTWNAISNADGYYISVGTTSGGTDVLNAEDVTNTTFNLPADLDENTEYFVTIIPYNSVGNATGCTEESFTTEGVFSTLECTVLVSPLENEMNVSVDTDISWQAVNNATGYYLNVGTDSGVWDILDNFDVGNVTTFDLPNDLPANSEIFVMITPYDDINTQLNCDETGFGTGAIATVPDCTTLISPLNGTTDVSISTDLTWNTISNADGYYISVGTSSGGTDVLNAEDVTNTTFNLPTDLDENTEYFVTIIPYNSVGNATGCSEESFTTETIATIPDCTTLISPLNGTTDVSITTGLTWNVISNADGYYVSVGTTSGGTDVLNAEDVTNTTFNLPADLDENTEYFVTIIPYNSVGNALGCTEESFTTESIATTLECTTLTIPLAGATNVSVATNFTWNAVENATGYRINLGDDINFYGEYDAGNSLTYDLGFDLPENTLIHVRIIPYDANGNENQTCSYESFTTGGMPTIPDCTNITSPVNNATNVSLSTAINWAAISNANGYFLTVGTSSGSNDLLDNFDVGNVSTYNLPADLPENTEIFVSIIPYNSAGNATGCNEERFTTVNNNIIPICTRLISPLDLEIDVSPETDLTWVSEPNATGYRLSVGTFTNGTDILDNFDVGFVTTYNLATDLPENTQIFVNIVPYNNNGEPFGCFEESFTTGIILVTPNCTQLQSPINSSVNVSVATDLNWLLITEATGYILTVGTTSGSTDIIDNLDVGNVTIYDLPSDLPLNTEIFVSIYPYNEAGVSVECAEQSFTTEATNFPEPEDTKYGFSPDGNGINEFWDIKGIENFPNNEVNIYNRWGDLVFAIKGYDNNSRVFRGEANKKTKLGAGKLPSGTYFFDIQISGQHNLKKTKGYVIIKR